MITEAPPPLSHIFETIHHLRSDLENVQRELEQALEVWRTTLIKEKKDFQTLLQTQQQSWTEEDQQWQQQRETYERKIQDLEKTFEERITLTEQNALRALNELDDAWQRDKLQWQQDSARRIKELELQEIQRAVEGQKQESAILELQGQILQLEAFAENQSRDVIQNQTDWNEKQDAWNHLRKSYEDRIQRLEASVEEAAQRPPTLDTSIIEDLKTSWEREKAVWQQSLYDNILQLNERETHWSQEREKQDRFLHKLQDHVVELQSLLTGMESEKLFMKNFLDNCVKSLDSEITVLHEMIMQGFARRAPSSPVLVGHPMRRKTDLRYAFR